MAYFEDADLTYLDLDLYLADEQGRIGRLATLGCNIYPALLSRTVHSIVNYYFGNLAKKRSGYTELFQVLSETAPESTKKRHYHDAETRLYCFDRGKDEENSRAYRLVLVPDNPIHLDEIPDPVRQYLWELRLPISFESCSEIPDTIIVPNGRRLIPKLTEVEQEADQKLTDRQWRNFIDSMQLDLSFDPESKTYFIQGCWPSFCPKCLDEREHFIRPVIYDPNWGKVLFFKYPFLRGFFLNEFPTAYWSKKIMKCPCCDFRSEYAERLVVYWKKHRINLPPLLAGMCGIERRDY